MNASSVAATSAGLSSSGLDGCRVHRRRAVSDRINERLYLSPAKTITVTGFVSQRAAVVLGVSLPNGSFLGQLPLTRYIFTLAW